MSTVRVATTQEWSQACSAAFVPLSVVSSVPTFMATLEQRHLDTGVTITRVDSDASTVVRDRGQISREPRDDILLSLHEQGTGQVAQHGRLVNMSAGSAAMYDASRPYALSFGEFMSETVVQVPRAMIGVTERGITDSVARHIRGGPALCALSALVSHRGLESDIPPMAGTALAESVASLVTALLIQSDARLDDDAMIVVVRRHITDNLHHSQLCPSSIAAAHNMSLRTLQNMFAQNGDSVAAFIQRKRLERARRLLATGLTVGQTARRTGYADTDTFSRAFKRQYGSAPAHVITATQGLRCADRDVK